MFSRSVAGWVALVLSLATGGPARAQPNAASERPPALAFTRTPQLAGMVIAPSGQRVAVIATTAGGRRAALVQTLADDATPKVLASFADLDVTRVAWINDTRLLIETEPSSEAWMGERGATFAIDADGENQTKLGVSRFREASGGWRTLGELDDGSPDLLVVQLMRDSQGQPTDSRLARMNTVTGVVQMMPETIPSFAYHWLLDSKGALRIVATERDGRHKILWRKPGGDAWSVVLDQPTLGRARLIPRFLEDDDTLLVDGRAGDDDVEALYALQLSTGKLGGTPIAAIKGFDLDATLIVDRQARQLIGLRSRGERPLSLWFDERLARVQAAVDKALPGRWNRISCGRCASAQHFIVHSASDTESGEYLHYDHTRQRLRSLGFARPWLPAATQASRSFHRVAARDGLALPVVVTHPAGAVARPLPAVMLVHGGPWLRGSDRGWQAEAQFLASRGYRVIEVESRGRAGYGWRHFEAGWKQWGTGMQDDLADVLGWAESEKLIDPQRVCLYGSSYGGYAALMAPIRHPGRFRCAAGFAAPTDPELIFTATWGNFTPQALRYTLPTLIGDPDRDAELLRAASPLKRVAELKVPVLLAYGALDRRVPREHAERFESAARKAGAKLEVVRYHDQGHGWSEPKQHADFLQRLEAFLARELGR